MFADELKTCGEEEITWRDALACLKNTSASDKLSLFESLNESWNVLSLTKQLGKVNRMDLVELVSRYEQNENHPTSPSYIGSICDEDKDKQLTLDEVNSCIDKLAPD